MTNSPLRIGVLASGKGSNLRAILTACKRKRLHGDVVVVISDRAEALALTIARRAGVEALAMDPKPYAAREQFDEAVVKELQQRRVELIALAGYMRIVTTKMIEPFRHRIMNIHPALLPAFPGLKAPQQALDRGATLAGCTVHFVTEEVDGGPIIVQAAVPVRAGEPESSLARRIQRQEHRLYPRAIDWFARGRLRLDGRTVRVRGARVSPSAALVNPPLGG